jgi:sulfhydrogenase subunit delta
MAEKAKKPKIAVFDLTDCEGCELQFVALREKLSSFFDKVEIVNWRLLAQSKAAGPFDITFVEGVPVSKSEVESLKRIRKQSKYLIALGACACTGGVNALVEQKDRKKLTEYVYSKDYKPRAVDAKPLNYYVDVDLYLNGCPVNPHEIERVISSLLAGRKPEPRPYPVCLECKAAGNECLLQKGEPCLGPVTAGGCEALCTSRGFACFGCWGPVKQANIGAMVKTLEKIIGPEETKKRLAVFFRQTKEYKDYYGDK